MTRDYERLPENHEGMIYVVSKVRKLSRRSCHNGHSQQITLADLENCRSIIVFLAIQEAGRAVFALPASS